MKLIIIRMILRISYSVGTIHFAVPMNDDPLAFNLLDAFNLLELLRVFLFSVSLLPVALVFLEPRETFVGEILVGFQKNSWINTIFFYHTPFGPQVVFSYGAKLLGGGSSFDVFSAGRQFCGIPPFPRPLVAIYCFIDIEPAICVVYHGHFLIWVSSLPALFTKGHPNSYGLLPPRNRGVDLCYYLALCVAITVP